MMISVRCRLLFIVCLLKRSQTADQEQRRKLVSCPSGSVASSSGEFCCPIACGSCGGSGCNSRPGGAAQCCTSQITNLCGNPPCIASDNALEATFMTCPSGSIADWTGTKCCPETCNKCGGTDCNNRPGGSSQCCTSHISEVCNGKNLPCYISKEDTSQSYEDSASNNSIRCPLNGILNSSGTKCCPTTCGTCGGTNCQYRSGGADQCCMSNVTQSCSLGILPCMLEVPSTSNGNEVTLTIDTCPHGGILSSSGLTCCPTSCGKCGGPGCNNFPGGDSKCCTSKVTTTCDENSTLPCNLLTKGSNNPVQNPSNEPLTNEGSDSSCTDGIKATFYDTCEIAVCCPARCGVCDTSETCDPNDECCARNVVEMATSASTDVDVSCKSKAAPCIIPPADDHCKENPCRGGARCGIAYESVDGECWTHAVCECEEAGRYTGEYCEKQCEDGGEPCGRARPQYFSTITFANYECCSSNEKCVQVNTEKGWETKCVSQS